MSVIGSEFRLSSERRISLFHSRNRTTGLRAFWAMHIAAQPEQDERWAMFSVAKAELALRHHIVSIERRELTYAQDAKRAVEPRKEWLLCCRDEACFAAQAWKALLVGDMTDFAWMFREYRMAKAACDAAHDVVWPELVAKADAEADAYAARVAGRSA